jgi:hypothetical protein
MSAVLTPVKPTEIVYPESDGQPMADNGKQFVWIVVLFSGFLMDQYWQFWIMAVIGLFIPAVLLALPLKVICQSDCRGLCPSCGANLNHEECRCETHATDPRMAPLARLKQDWLKKQ